MVEEKSPRTSVIIPTWNGRRVLTRCLHALEQLEVPEGGFEVIVVDNGSTDGTELELRRNFSWIKFIRLERNVGFARACNCGILAARGLYLVLLNNDTVPRRSWLRSLVGRANWSEAGAIGSKVVYRSDPRVLNNAGSLLFPQADWPVRDRGINEVDDGQYDHATDVSAFCGTAVLLKRVMLEQVGLFDEHFFMYWEDADLSWRVRDAGWTIEFEPSAIVEHVHAASSGEMSDFFRYHVSRNRVLVLAKHAQAGTVGIAVVKVIGVFLVGASRGIRRRNIRRAYREMSLLLALVASWVRCTPWVVARRVGLTREARLPRVRVAEGHTATGVCNSVGRRLKVGIYNPYLGTFGGGERLSVAMAEALCREHDVELLARRMHGVPEVGELERRFDVRLPGVSVVDLDGIVGIAPGDFGGRWLASVRRRAADLRDYWLVRSRGYDLFINNQFWSLMRCPTDVGIYVCMFPRLKNRERIGASSTLEAIALRVAYAMDNVILDKPDEAMLSYSSVVAISEFTNKWLREWWRISGRVIYPPCRDWYVEGIGKRKVILSVGRFFPPSEERHDKRHDVLIEGFSLLSLLHPDWELHLAGSCGGDGASEKYVESLRAMAAGLNVKFHINAPPRELEVLYNEARIYWHATGFGAELGKHPEREEHFGITTVEAMSAGAVPVVFPGGGQREIVADGVNGYFWESLRGLVEGTMTLIEDEAKWEAMSLKARYGAQAFSVDRFRDEFVREVEHVVFGARAGRAWMNRPG